MFAHVLSSPNDDESHHMSLFVLPLDIGNKLIGSLDGLIHLFDQTVNFSFQFGCIARLLYDFKYLSHRGVLLLNPLVSAYGSESGLGFAFSYDPTKWMIFF